MSKLTEEPIAKKESIPKVILERLREGERRGEVTVEPRTQFGPLPVIRLAKPVRLDRILKAAKR